VSALALTIEAAAEMLSVDVAAFDEHVRPKLRILRIGDQERVPVSELVRLVDGDRRPVPLAVDPRTAASMISCSRSFWDEHVAHQIRVVREGGKVLVPVDEIGYYLGRRRDKNGSGR
jgi:hypothetical protein